MYQVLYRKWRPQSFADVIGQPHVTTTLINELQAGRLSHAYLFTGSRGTGKTTCAKILSKAVNCLNPQNGNPCNECEICKGIDNGSILDVVEIDAASNNGVDNIRDLRDEANFTPANAKYRVYIIDEVHMLSTGAFNALLKTLEEPPEHVKFILATTEVHKLPATILSRCQRFDFKRITPQEIAQRLQYIAGQEGFQIDEQGALLIARIADGAMRDALSILDQCVGRSKNIDINVVTQAVGMTGKDHLFELSDAINTNNSALALDCLDRLHNNSCDMERLCSELINHYRNYMICKATDKPQELIICTEDELNKMKEYANSVTIESILHTLDLLQDTLRSLRSGADRRIAMEMVMLKLCMPQLNTSNEAILKRLSALEAGNTIKKVASAESSAQPVTRTEPAKSVQVSEPKAQEKAEIKKDDVPLPFDDIPPVPDDIPFDLEPQQAVPPEPPIQAEPIPSPAVQPQAEQHSDSGVTVFANWPEVLEEVYNLDPPLKSFLTKSQAYIKNGAKVIVKTNSPTLHEMLKQDFHRNMLKKAITNITGKDLGIAFVKPSAENENTVKKDPLSNLAEKLNSSGVQFEIE